MGHSAAPRLCRPQHGFATTESDHPQFRVKALLEPINEPIFLGVSR